jgi:steroid delta-isomerase-like uncharacterized protein
MQQSEAIAPAHAADPGTSVFQALIENVWNARRVEALDDLLAPGFIMHTTAGLRLDAAAYATVVRAHHEGFPDLAVELLATVHEGDVLAARLRIAGTMTGPFGGHPATGRAMRVEGRPWVRLEGGRIAELWSLMDDADMWAQLGLPAHTR